MVAKKLYCGNLKFGISAADLEALFSEYGSVSSAMVVTDRESGRSKGFGFVEMESDAEAEAAIANLNEKEIEGRPIVVNEARPREERPRRGSAERGGRRY